LGTDLKAVNRYTLPTAALVGFEYVFLRPTGHRGRELIRGVVYGDANGVPGPLLAVTNELAYQSAGGAGWAALTFTPYLRLPPGSYWIGVISGGQPSVADITYDNVPGVLAFNHNAYASGPSDPFGPPTPGDQLVALYLDYLAQS
jgi:hypothetical protein